MTSEKLRPSETAVVVIDMLNDFVTGALKCDRAQMIIPNIRALIVAARKADVAVVYSNDAHSPDDHEIKVAWAPHAMIGTKGAEIIPELAPAPGEHVSAKSSYSAFYETDLDEYLKSKGITTLVLVGLHTDCCIRHTAADAFFRRYRLIIPEDCVQAFTEEAHTSGLEYLKYWYKADTHPSRDVTGAWCKSG